MLSKEALSSFKRLYLKEFGVTLSDSEATDKATRLLRLFQIVYRPIPLEWFIKLKKERS